MVFTHSLREFSELYGVTSVGSLIPYRSWGNNEKNETGSASSMESFTKDGDGGTRME